MRSKIVSETEGERERERERERESVQREFANTCTCSSTGPKQKKRMLVANVGFRESCELKQKNLQFRNSYLYAPLLKPLYASMVARLAVSSHLLCGRNRASHRPFLRWYPLALLPTQAGFVTCSGDMVDTDDKVVRLLVGQTADWAP